MGVNPKCRRYSISLWVFVLNAEVHNHSTSSFPLPSTQLTLTNHKGSLLKPLLLMNKIIILLINSQW
jgi:hypothetical protein